MTTAPRPPLTQPPSPAPQPGGATARRTALRRLGAWALAIGAPAPWAQTPRRAPDVAPPRLREAPEPPPVADPELVGLRSVLETAVRDAFAAYPDGWPSALRGHLQEQWDHWQRFGPPSLSPGSPWSRFEAFESLARHTASSVWELAGTSLAVEAHRLPEAQVRELHTHSQSANGSAPWLTAWFESAYDSHLHQRLVGLIVDLQLAWLLIHRDRYPRNPAARHAQIEAEDWAICSGLTRSWVRAVFDSIAAQERRLRADPRLAGSNQPMKTQLTRLGPAPAHWPRRRLAGPERDLYQPRL